MSRQNKQKGFVAPAAVIVIGFIILALAGEGYYLFNRANKVKILPSKATVESKKDDQNNITKISEEKLATTTNKTINKTFPGSHYRIQEGILYYNGTPLGGDGEKIDVDTFQIIEGYWAKDKHFIYFAGKKTALDTMTFKVLSRHCCYDAYNHEPEAFNFASDKNAVYAYYYNPSFFGVDAILNKLEDADPSTFSVRDYGANNDYKNGREYKYGIDAKNIYSAKGKKVVGADAASFVFLNSIYAKDKNNIYYGIELSILEHADVPTFSIGVRYAKDKNYVYRGDQITGFDPLSFKPIKGEYNMDKNGIYYNEQIINDADSGSFVVFENKDNFAKDKNNLYYNGKKLLGVDVKSAVLLTADIVKDYRGVYRVNTFCYNANNSASDACFEKIQEADAETFKFLVTRQGWKWSEHYFKDKNYVYAISSDSNVVNKISMEDVDMATFESVGSNFFSGRYFTDKNRVYYNSNDKPHEFTIIENADSATFVFVDVSQYETHYAKDKNGIYYNGKTVSGADVANYNPLGVMYAKDAHNVYLGGIKITDADAETFFYFGDYVEDGMGGEYFRSGYAKDKNHVWYGDKPNILNQADPFTFSVVGTNIGVEVVAKDKNYVYANGIVQKGVNPADCTKETIEKCRSVLE